MHRGNHFEKKRNREIKQLRNCQALKLLRLLYKGVHGMEASRKYRQVLKQDDNVALTYGEIVPESFIQILDRCRNDSSGGVFVDLGCGAGKALFCAALSSQSFDRVVGIELVPELCVLASSVHRELSEEMKYVLNESIPVDERGQNAYESSKANKPSLNGLSNDELLRLVSEVVAAANSNDRTIDMISNRVCQSLGHKLYKASIKPHKTFQRFLLHYPSVFRCADNIILLVRDETNLSSSAVQVCDDSNADMCDKTAAMDVQEDEDSSRDRSRTEAIRQVLRDAVKKKTMTYLPAVEVLSGDMFSFDWWRYADVVYAASLLFTDSMMLLLSQQARRLKVGSWIITLKTILLDRDYIEDSAAEEHHQPSILILRYNEYFKMSWRMADVYFYEQCGEQA